MDSQAIAKHILEHGGITLTHSRVDAKLTSGYAVSRVGHEIRLPRQLVEHVSDGFGFKRAELDATVFDAVIARASFVAFPAAYVGAWLDGDSVVFDVTDVYADFVDALDRAFDRGQKAIFSFAENCEVFVQSEVKA